MYHFKWICFVKLSVKIAVVLNLKLLNTTQQQHTKHISSLILVYTYNSTSVLLQSQNQQYFISVLVKLDWYSTCCSSQLMPANSFFV